jgi:hypothetical protein
VDLGWIGTCSKNFICRGVLFRKTAEQRLTKLSLTLFRNFKNPEKFTADAQLGKQQLS